MLQALNSLPALTRRAQDISRQWLTAHSVAAYCDTIETIGGWRAGPNAARSAKPGPELDSAFPVWPNQDMSALPQSQEAYAHGHNGLHWRDDGSARLTAPQGQVGLMTPAVAAPTRLELTISAGSANARGAAHFTLNGFELGAARLAADPQTVSLTLPRAHISAALPCLLQIKLSDGAEELVVHGARFATARTPLR